MSIGGSKSRSWLWHGFMRRSSLSLGSRCCLEGFYTGHRKRELWILTLTLPTFYFKTLFTLNLVRRRHEFGAFRAIKRSYFMYIECILISACSSNSIEFLFKASPRHCRFEPPSPPRNLSQRSYCTSHPHNLPPLLPIYTFKSSINSSNRPSPSAPFPLCLKYWQPRPSISLLKIPKSSSLVTTTE